MNMDMEVVMYIHHSQHSTEGSNWFIWAKRLGWFALLVLLVKGVVWATLPLLLVFVGVSV